MWQSLYFNCSIRLFHDILQLLPVLCCWFDQSLTFVVWISPSFIYEQEWGEWYCGQTTPWVVKPTSVEEIQDLIRFNKSHIDWHRAICNCLQQESHWAWYDLSHCIARSAVPVAVGWIRMCKGRFSPFPLSFISFIFPLAYFTSCVPSFQLCPSLPYSVVTSSVLSVVGV